MMHKPSALRLLCIRLDGKNRAPAAADVALDSPCTQHLLPLPQDHRTPTLALNYRAFLGSCRLSQFTFFEDISRHILLRISANGPPFLSNTKRNYMRIEAIFTHKAQYIARNE